jgi:hypothetical protein
MLSDDVGKILGRTGRSCRIAVHNLLKVYRVKGYEGTFGQPRPDGLLEPPPKDDEKVAKEAAAKAAAAAQRAASKKPARHSKAKASGVKKGKKAAADSASEREAHRLAKKEAADLSEKEVVRIATANMAHASDHLRELAHREAKAADEAAERMARGSAAHFRETDGRRLVSFVPLPSDGSNI